MSTYRISKKVINTLTEYVVFPRGDRYGKLEDAITNRGAGWIREFTIVIKQIEIANGPDINTVQGTYISSREINEKLSGV